jgi:hypothetical protein
LPRHTRHNRSRTKSLAYREHKKERLCKEQIWKIDVLTPDVLLPVTNADNTFGVLISIRSLAFQQTVQFLPDSIVYSDIFSFYNVLDVPNSKLFSEQKNYINGIENFWNLAKRHMRRFNGIPAVHFHLF